MAVQWAGAQNLAGQLAGVVAPIVTGFIVDRTGAFSGVRRRFGVSRAGDGGVGYRHSTGGAGAMAGRAHAGALTPASATAGAA